MTTPRSPVTLLRRPPRPGAVVLLLHGGRETATEPPPRWNPPALRMLPFVPALARAVPDAVLGMARYRHRGWNGDRADAALDARRALANLTAAHPDLPVVLVGHSMGGRAALAVGGHPAVRGVVALAPWCPAGEPAAHLVGRSVALVHSDADRVTSPVDTWRFVARAREAGVAVCGMEIPDGDHAMLRRAALWHRLTARLVRGVLAGGQDCADLPRALATALGGRAPESGGGPAARSPDGAFATEEAGEEAGRVSDRAVPGTGQPLPRADLRAARAARRLDGGTRHTAHG